MGRSLIVVVYDTSKEPVSSDDDVVRVDGVTIICWSVAKLGRVQLRTVFLLLAEIKGLTRNGLKCMKIYSEKKRRRSRGSTLSSGVDLATNEASACHERHNCLVCHVHRTDYGQL